jgi:hypothetical protein
VGTRSENLRHTNHAAMTGVRPEEESPTPTGLASPQIATERKPLAAPAEVIETLSITTTEGKQQSEGVPSNQSNNACLSSFPVGPTTGRRGNACRILSRQINHLHITNNNCTTTSQARHCHNLSKRTGTKYTVHSTPARQAYKYYYPYFSQASRVAVKSTNSTNNQARALIDFQATTSYRYPSSTFESKVTAYN